MNKITFHRNTLYAICAIFFLCGFVLTVSSPFAYITAVTYLSFLAEEYRDGTIISMAVGVMILISATAGILGIYRNNSKILLFCLCGFVLLLIMEVVVASYRYTYNVSFENIVRINMVKSWKTYNETRSEETIWDSLQINFKCCGVNSANDYNWNQVPPSCCLRRGGPRCQQSESNVAGCFRLLMERYAAQSTLLAVAATVAAIAELIMIISGFAYYSSMPEKLD